MIRIQQLKLPITHTEEQLLHKLAKALRVRTNEIVRYKIRRQSVDARRKSEVSFVYTIDVSEMRKRRCAVQRENRFHWQGMLFTGFPKEGSIPYSILR